MNTPKDTRIQYNHERVEYGGNVWYFTDKADPIKRVLKVYRVEGDVTSGLHLEALQDFATKLGLKIKAAAK